MDNIFAKRPNGYQDSISKGIAAAHYFRGRASYGKGGRNDQIKRLKEEIENADAILIGAGAGLSTSAGFTYTGERFDKYFFDFAKTFSIKDIYSGGFFSSRRKKYFGHGGQGVFILTDMLMLQNLCIRIYLTWLRIRTIL